MSEIPDKSMNGGHDFRLEQITKIKEFFEQEIENRRKVLKKYKKSCEVINGIVHFLTAAEVVSGSITTVSMAGVITAPVGIALGSVTVVMVATSFGLNFGKKNITKKISKHEQIYTLAASKLNTINDIISKALSDSVISSEEFSLIIQEKEKYITLKNKIRIEHKNITEDEDFKVRLLSHVKKEDNSDKKEDNSDKKEDNSDKINRK